MYSIHLGDYKLFYVTEITDDNSWIDFVNQPKR